MAGLVPAIHVFLPIDKQGMDFARRTLNRVKSDVMAKSPKRTKNKAAGKAEVETYRHKEAKRKNIPTAENQKLIDDDDKAIKKLRWPRNPDLDPQLVWRGKDVEPDPLEVDAPPIYIQEKIKPQAIIEDLRRQTRERSKDAAPQFDFFHDFNGLPEGWKEDATASYYHDEGNWSNRMILGDSLISDGLIC